MPEQAQFVELPSGTIINLRYVTAVIREATGTCLISPCAGDKMWGANRVSDANGGEAVYEYFRGLATEIPAGDISAGPQPPASDGTGQVAIYLASPLWDAILANMSPFLGSTKNTIQLQLQAARKANAEILKALTPHGPGERKD